MSDDDEHEALVAPAFGEDEDSRMALEEADDRKVYAHVVGAERGLKVLSRTNRAAMGRSRDERYFGIDDR